MVALIPTYLLRAKPAPIVAVSAIADFSPANQSPVLLDKIQHSLLGIIRCALDWHKLDAFMIFDVILPLRLVVLSLRLIHYQHHSIVYGCEVPLL